MSLCPSNCVDPELTPLPEEGCEVKRRKRGLKKIGFFACSVGLPDPLTCTTLLALMDSNQVVWSNDLVNNEFADPETETYQIADCSPSVEETVGRVLTVEDHIAVDVAATPSGVATPFADIQFWGNKKKYALTLRYMFLYCDGTIEVPKDESGKPLAATMNVIRVQNRVTTGNNTNIYEIKRATINFKGDPLAVTEDYAPDLIIESGDTDCDTLATRLGLSL